MKKVIWLFAILATSCFIENENDELYQSYGVVKEDADTSGKLYIRSDQGKVLIPTLSNLVSNEDRDKRVWMKFSTSDDIKSDTIKVNVYDLQEITQIDFKQENNDLIVSDKVSLQDIWIAQGYLTLIMNVAAASENSLQKHLYTMYSDMEIVNDTVRMEFKYDRKNDSHNAQFDKVVALKLDDKIPAQGSDSVITVIKFRTNTGLKERYITYKK
jgi:hypothetical protein